MALWHERDISHSSVERVVLPDASLLAYYVLAQGTGLVDGLVVDPERMLANLDRGSHGLVFSQSVLLALVSGRPQPRRRLPDRAAGRHGGLGRGTARSARVLDDDPEVTAGRREALDEPSTCAGRLRHVDRFTDALDGRRPMTHWSDP